MTPLPTLNDVVVQNVKDEPPGVADVPDATPDDDAVIAEISAEHTDDIEEDARSVRVRWRMAPPRLALVTGLTMTAALVALVGFLGVQAYHAQRTADLHALYLQVGRQGALNLTTIDWHHADADVHRILGMATGTFYDDFSQRSQPFIDVVKKVQSVSKGTVTVSGVESATDTEAQVLAAVSVQTTTNEAPEPSSRAWRMRLSVEKVGGDVKVSSVEFVP